jgi:methionyl-tRNA formyltransferase
VTAWRGEPLKIARAALAPAAGSQAPGTVMQAGPDALIVATGEGALAVTELQPAGKRRLSAREFLSGYKVQVGDRFGG